jgi:putative transposon-encoded protein
VVAMSGIRYSLIAAGKFRRLFNKSKIIGIPMEEKTTKDYQDFAVKSPWSRVKFEIYGREMIEKSVKLSGTSGRVSIPPEWIGKNVKIIRID